MGVRRPKSCPAESPSKEVAAGANQNVQVSARLLTIASAMEGSIALWMAGVKTPALQPCTVAREGKQTCVKNRFDLEPGSRFAA